MKGFLLSGVIVSSFCLPLVVRAELEVITLKSGRQIRGIVVDEDTNSVEVATADGTHFKLDRNKIKKIGKAEGGRSPLNEASALREAGVTRRGSKEIKIGLQLGLSQSNVSFAPATSTSVRTGLVAGAHIEFKLKEKLSLRPELIYNQGGYIVHIVGAETVFRYDVIKIPFYLKYDFPSNDEYFFSVFTGPAVGFRVKAETVAAGVTTDLGPTTASVAWMWDVGGGVDYWLNPNTTLFLNARMLLGLNNLSTIAATSVKNTDFQAVAGTSFVF